MDMVASCSSMQKSLGGLFATPGLPAVVQETKAAAETAFVEMAALAKKLAGFEATVRAAMLVAGEAKPPAEQAAGEAAPPRAAAKEQGTEGEGGEKVAEGAGGKGGRR